MMDAYERLLEEARNKAGIYTKDWTNMQESEPALTILENLTAFHLVQKEAAGRVTDDARLLLLKLAGFAPAPARKACVLAEAPDGGNSVSFLPHQKFYAGDICFETDMGADDFKGALQSIYRKEKGVLKEIKELRRGVPLSEKPFGKKPGKGDAIYLLFDTFPKKEELHVLLYANVKQTIRRNAFSREEPVEFARLRWSANTVNGYEEIPYRDETHGFLQSGIIELVLDGSRLVKERVEHKEGYMLRCMIREASYDLAPELTAVYGPVIPLVQKDSQSFCVCEEGREQIAVANVFPDEMFLTVYVQERALEAYTEYGEYTGRGTADVTDRCYKKTADAYGNTMVSISNGRNLAMIRVICCNRNMMIHRELGTLCGYDGQEFEVEAFPHMDQDSLSLGVRYKDGQGQERCRFFRPGAEGKEDVVYTYEEEKNRIRVKSTGLYEGGQVFLCDCALSRWEEGNIRPGNSLVTQGGTAGICLTNPVMGTGGRRREGRKELTRRFVRDLKEPAAAVTDRDYEWLVKQIPGLCIRKTGVYYEEKKDLVCVVVQPWSGAEFPVLSPLYRQRIRDYLHKRKLLTTRIEVIDPVYIPVDVFLEVRVRDKGKWNTGELRVIIEKALDDRVNDRRIGEPVSFHKLSGDILAYPGTGNILKLKVSPRSRTGGVVYPGEDIPILPGGLCYPGDIVIQVSE